ncbi:MAG: hypothetical protein M1837_003432 [Sclerophora amabilis]|nr:MAG: hypothetical protein M1837_003432 [Sclerophora amabilis]
MSAPNYSITQSTTLLARLNTLTSDHKTTQSLITRLSKFPAQPGSAPSNSNSENDARVELSAAIHQSLKEQEEGLELLRQEVEDLPPAAGATGDRRRGSVGTGIGIGGRRESNRDSQGTGTGGDRTRLELGVKRLGEDLKLSRIQFRRAQLTAKRSAEAARRKERELLFAGIEQDSDGNEGPLRRRQPPGKEKLSQDELLVNASSDVTAALRRTHQLMSSELSRSQFAQDTLDQSTAALASLGTHYSTLDTLLSSSRTLLGTLLRSQKTDTWYLESAFYILLCTIAWLVFRRFLYGPLWWFVWLPIKFIFGTGSWITATLFGIGANQGIGNSNTVVGQQSASVSDNRGTLIVQPSAAKTGGFPTWGNMANNDGPSVIVGGGGKRDGEAKPPAATGEAESLTEKVGKMVDESTHQGEGKGEGGAGTHSGGDGEKRGNAQGEDITVNDEDVPRNPKKRMWEEDLGNGKGKDEL